MPDNSEPWYLRKLRDKVRLLNASVQKHFAAPPDVPPPDPALYQAAVEELRRLETDGPDGRAYLEKHIPRLARTLTLIPRPYLSARALELGCYRSEEHTSELQSPCNLVCPLLLEKKKKSTIQRIRSSTRSRTSQHFC